MARYNDTLAADRKGHLVGIETRRESRLFCVVRLQHLWGEFCRELLVRSAVGGASTISGIYLPQVPGIKRAKDVDLMAAQIMNRRRFIEWYMPAYISKIAHMLKLVNQVQIIQGMNPDDTINDIRSVRNYIVHPTYESYQRYSNTAGKFGVFDPDPDILLSSSISPGNVTLFEDWVIQLQEITLNASW